MAQKIQNHSSELEAWAKKFGVSTLFDYDKFENREFLKKLDEARPVYDKMKKQEEELAYDFR